LEPRKKIFLSLWKPIFWVLDCQATYKWPASGLPSYL
jgi:hypothetical protein